MKFSSILLLLVAVDATSAERRFGVGSKVTTAHNKQLPKALFVRGGGGSRDLKDNLVTAATVLQAGHGLLSLAAPEKVPDVFYQGTFKIEQGSAAELWQEHVGSSLLGMALMTYMAAHTTVNPTNSVVYASGLCAYVFFRHLVKGTYKKLGFSENYINVSWLTFLTIIGLGGAILSDKYDTDLLTKIYISLPALMGLVQWISPGTMKSFAGLDAKNHGPVDDCMMHWWHTALIVWSILAYSVAIEDSTVYEAAGRAATVFGLIVVDLNFIRKQDAPLNLTDTMKYLFPLIQLVVGAGLLKK